MEEVSVSRQGLLRDTPCKRAFLNTWDDSQGRDFLRARGLITKTP